MNNVLLKYLCVRENNMPSSLHQIPSRHTKFFTDKIKDHFKNKGFYSKKNGNFIKFSFLFTRVDEFEMKALKRLIRDVRCYFNELCAQNPDKFYTELIPIDWYKYSYVF